MKFLHSMIRVSNLDESMRFYEGLLGLKPSAVVRLEDCTLHYLRDEKTGVEIELTVNDEIPENGYSQGTAFGHFAFEVDDMNAVSKNVLEQQLFSGRALIKTRNTGHNGLRAARVDISKTETTTHLKGE